MVDIESTTPHASTLPASSLCSIDISLEDTFLALSSCDPSKAMGGDLGSSSHRFSNMLNFSSC